ncbi:MAG: hypothetical protein ABSA58_02515 [Acetobacteraceae bacterium]|jgi:hypothetical protein
MRKFLVALGAMTLAVVVAAGIGVGILIYKGKSLDRESKAYVDSAVPAIVTVWSKDALLDRATPELRANARPEDLRSLFDWASRLGPFVAYEGATGDSNMSFMPGGNSTVSARYAAKVRFRDGTATIRIVLLKRDGNWLINSFHIEPKLTGNATSGA